MMATHRLLKVLAVAGLVAAAALHRSADRGSVVLLLFGVLNLLLVLPGTRWIRRGAVAVSMLALASRPESRVVMGMLLWLVWPPMFMVAWALGADRQGSNGGAEAEH